MENEWVLTPAQAARLRTAYNIAVGAQLAAQAATNVAQQTAAQYEQKVAELRLDLAIEDTKLEIDLDAGVLRPAKEPK